MKPPINYKIAYWIIFLISFWGFIDLFSGYYSLGGFSEPARNEITRFVGTLELDRGPGRSRKIRIANAASGHKYITTGYRNDFEDFGKTVVLLVARNRVFQIQRDDIIKVSYIDTVKRAKSNIKKGFTVVLVGVLLYAITFFVRSKGYNSLL